MAARKFREGLSLSGDCECRSRFQVPSHRSFPHSTLSPLHFPKLTLSSSPFCYSFLPRFPVFGRFSAFHFSLPTTRSTFTFCVHVLFRNFTPVKYQRTWPIMGIKGLWDIIGDCVEVVPLAQLGRPLRIAVDEAGWRFNNLTPKQVEDIQKSTFANSALDHD